MLRIKFNYRGFEIITLILLHTHHLLFWYVGIINTIEYADTTVNTNIIKSVRLCNVIIVFLKALKMINTLNTYLDRTSI